MNIVFWALTILMCLLAIAGLVYPLLKTRQTASLAYKESNLNINDEKIKELDLDLEEGRIDQEFYKAAREELDRELLIDIPEESQQTASQHYTSAAKRQPALALIISVFVPALALLVYLDLGMHAASDESFVASQQQQPSSQQMSIEEMARKLEDRIKENGGTAEEWAMLARSHKYLKEYTQAANAFAVALDQDSNNAQLMLERAEMLALSNNQRFTPQAMELVLKAYELQPHNPNVLWFAGVAEYQSGNYRKAIEHLTTLLPLVIKDENAIKSVTGYVSQARQQLIAAGEQVPALEELLGSKVMLAVAQQSKAQSSSPQPTTTQQAKQSTASAGIKRLEIAVEISDSVRNKFNAGDIVFVYAKAKQGPRMPLAAQRMTLAELPATIVLDDTMGMVAGMNIGAFDQLVVSARVSRSGSAIAQSGDFIGSIDVNAKNAATLLNVVIETVIP